MPRVNRLARLWSRAIEVIMRARETGQRSLIHSFQASSSQTKTVHSFAPIFGPRKSLIRNKNKEKKSKKKKKKKKKIFTVILVRTIGQIQNIIFAF
jgi:hypothetical protein